ncbi:MAG TPA: glycosyltransferase [Edaphocola sp.]|nr:glycosyltransferase [Edaphocola sp.]
MAKIFILGTAYPLRGGIATFNQRLATYLQEAGHDVTIYSYSLQYPSFLFPGKSQFSDEAAPENLKIETVINSVNPFNWWKIGNKIRKEKPDLIIPRFWMPFFGPSLGTILRLARKNKHTQSIPILDNVIPHEKRIGDKPFTNYFLKANDGFLTMSHEVLADLRKFDTKKPAVYTPHPLYDVYGEEVERDIALKKLGLPNEHKYLLFFGFIRKYKGLDILLEAMAQKSLKENNIHLIVAGEFYEDEALYRQKIKELNIEDQVHLFSEFIPNEEVKYYFSAADVVVQPYRSATQSGISQIAYFFEKPMIVTNVGGLPEIVPHQKVGLVAEVNSKSIAESIEMIYQDGVIESFKKHIPEEKKKYEWGSFVTSIFNLKKQIDDDL